MFGNRLLIVFLSLLLSTIFVRAIRYEGSAEADFARSSYIQLEKSLWEKYVDKVSSLTPNERLYKIFNQHYMFVQEHVSSDYNHEDFNVLRRYYEWENLEPDVKSIHQLFKDNFLHRINYELDQNEVRSGGFDERANLDLAETVISDPLWPTNATLEKIQVNIYNQGLYYKAIAVCVLQRCFFFAMTNDVSLITIIFFTIKMITVPTGSINNILCSPKVTATNSISTL
jgi:hypothetical protein